MAPPCISRALMCRPSKCKSSPVSGIRASRAARKSDSTSPAVSSSSRRGHPEPDAARYCAPARCYCGGCPSWTPDTAYYPGETVLDIRAVASGKRRSSLEQYRSAQANMTGGAA